MESIAQMVSSALNDEHNYPLLPFSSSVFATYVAVIIYAVYSRRPNIVDRAGTILYSNPLNKLNKTYDFIIIGGGTAGCVLANRLSENPQWNVLLLEAGTNELIQNRVPIAGSPKQANWGFLPLPSTKYGLSQTNNTIPYPKGKIIGGTSAINGMVYSRGNKRDYDRWRDIGNTGWSYEDVLPYFKKSENIRIPSLTNSSYHSRGGYLSIENIPYNFPIDEIVRTACTELGYKATDYNGANQTGHSPLQLTRRNGTRDDTARAFLHPAKNRPNLFVCLNAMATRILFNESNDTAIGVEFVKMNKVVNITKRAYARKEVILSAGSIQSPQLLMISGIGPVDHLIEKDIQIIRAMPGVGQNLQDQVGIAGIPFNINNPPNMQPYGVSLVYPNVLTNFTLASFIKNSSGPINVRKRIDAIIFANSKYNKNKDWPDIELIPLPGDSSDGGMNAKSQRLTKEAYNKVFKPYEYNFTFQIEISVLRPYSRGQIRLANKNPFVPPIIDLNYFNDSRDMEVLIEGAKIAFNLTQTDALKRYNVTLNPNVFGSCEGYMPLSNDYWKCMSQRYTRSMYHAVGTCKMGPRTDKMAVVDERLRVHRISNLRVIDASIMPFEISGHTMAPTIMIAEKGCDMIKEDWGFLIKQHLNRKTKMNMYTGFAILENYEKNLKISNALCKV